MAKDKHTTRLSADQIRAKVSAGQSQTDWNKVDATSATELDRRIAEDADEGPAHLGLDWTKAEIGLPERKAMVNLRLDADMLAWYRDFGKGYQTRMNAVLRSFYESHKPSSSQR